MAALAAFTLLDAGAARADFYATYAVSIDANTPDVTDILLFETFPPYTTSMTWSFQAPGGATTVIFNPFPRVEPPAQSFLVGVVNGLTSDGDSPVDHAVLFLNPDVAATVLAQNLSFADLFPGTQESDLISNIETISRTASGTDAWNASFDFMTNFNASVQGLSIGNGYFPGPTDSTPANATAIAFSDPQQIGTVTSTLVQVAGPGPISAPEPSGRVRVAGLALAVALGLVLRRRGLGRRRASLGEV